MPRFTRLLAALMILALSLVATPAHASEANEQVASADAESRQVQAERRFLQATNATRAQHGLGALQVNAELRDIARGWSGVMAAEKDLHHNPNYVSDYSGEWRGMAENVGYMTWPGGSVEQMVNGMHDAFLNSSGHFANLTGEAYNQVGIGVVFVDDTLWVTLNFLDGPVPAAQDSPREQDAEVFADSAPEEEEPLPYRTRGDY